MEWIDCVNSCSDAVTAFYNLSMTYKIINSSILAKSESIPRYYNMVPWHHSLVPQDFTSFVTDS